jgi:4-diphosphocytidyl-2-C-methyl-D-erythritol kinase
VTAFPVKAVAPAKVNLFLKVLGLLPDGRHELFCLTASLALADDVAVEDLGPGPGPDVLAVADDLIPPAMHTDPALAGPDSLVLRCVAELRAATGFPRRRVRVRIVRRVPYGAGLGGSSSDAAAAMTCINTLAPEPLSVRSLCELAMPLGADIPFFLEGPGARLIGGAGELSAPYLGPSLPGHVLLANPGEGLSTGEVFREYELTKSGPENIVTAFPALRKLPLPPPGENDLLTAALRLMPELDTLAGEVASAARGPHGMSGSGPTFWALFESAEEVAGAVRELRAKGRWALASSFFMG